MTSHRGRWWVHQPGSKSVSYPSHRQARRVAKQLSGASVSRNSLPCLLVLVLLPFLLPVAVWRHIRGGAR